jgi:hypothetical protein
MWVIRDSRSSSRSGFNGFDSRSEHTALENLPHQLAFIYRCLLMREIFAFGVNGDDWAWPI